MVSIFVMFMMSQTSITKILRMKKKLLISCSMKSKEIQNSWGFFCCCCCCLSSKAERFHIYAGSKFHSNWLKNENLKEFFMDQADGVKEGGKLPENRKIRPTERGRGLGYRSSWFYEDLYLKQ